ncbi:MAG: hypothetical protein Q4A32_04070 [Lachnospiraceae bacterium]|nr:hypothetical protein [Lachnospiraceae bacterium]
MKKLFSIALAAILVFSALALTACGGNSGKDESADLSDSKYVGTWTNTGLTLGEESGELDTEFTLILNDDGTGQLVSDEEPGEFTWELTDNGFKTKGDMKLTFTDDGDNIKTKILGADLTFEKQ